MLRETRCVLVRIGLFMLKFYFFFLSLIPISYRFNGERVDLLLLSQLCGRSTWALLPAVTPVLNAGRWLLWLLLQKKRGPEGHRTSQCRLRNAAVTSDPGLSVVYSNEDWFLAQSACPFMSQLLTFTSPQMQGWGSSPRWGHAALVAKKKDNGEEC